MLLSQLFIQMVEEDLSEITYCASVAGLNFLLDSPNDSIDVYVYGYTESLGKLAEIIFSFLTNFKISSDDKKRLRVFESQKERLERKYLNYSKSQAYRVAQYAFQGCVLDRFTISQRLDVFHRKFDFFLLFTLGFFFWTQEME